MKQPAEFDAFYQDARQRLLVQTYALTGDLAASRRAVRDAFVVAWHRWRKLQRLDATTGGAESVVRPHAWRLAQRRHTARMFHRDKSIDPDVKATLDALAKLPVAQRKALVLTQYASVTMAQMGREVDLPLEDAARELQSGAAALALAREVPTSALPMLFEQVAGSVDDAVRWPRPTIVRRAGAARRRAHTVVGVVGVVGTLLVSGALLTDTSGVHATLDRTVPVTARPVRPVAVEAVTVALPDTAMVTGDAIATALPSRRWTVARTTDNQAGSGLVLPCQTQRFADPQGAAALARTYRAAPAADRPAGAPKPHLVTATEFTEASTSTEAARDTYDTTVDWFADCGVDRMQLVATRVPAKVGDESVQLVLRDWGDPVTTYVVGVARTGQYTTTTVTSEQSSDTPDPATSAAFLASAVDALCPLDDAGACAPDRPALALVPPLPVGPAPALLSELDLPPVTGVDRPWGGSPAEPVTGNLAATRCDHETFTGRFGGRRFSGALTRTFLIQGAGLPKEFGLTETAAALPVAQARGLVDQVHARLAGCEDAQLGTRVTVVADRHDADTSLAAWRVSVQVSDAARVDFVMAVVRNATAVAQVGFVPARGVSMTDEQFVSLAQRALDRLGELPPPPTG